MTVNLLRDTVSLTLLSKVMAAPTRPHPRDAIAERNKEAILDAAERLIRRGETASIAAVAVEAAVSRPTVYSHFREREQILEALVARSVVRSTTALEASQPEAGDGAAALERMIAESWKQIARHEAVARAAATELSAHAMRRAHSAADAKIRAVIERGHRDGSINPDLPTEWLITATLALVHATAHDVQARKLKSRDAAGLLQAAMRKLTA